MLFRSAALAFAAAVLALEGVAAGAAGLAALGVLAVARALCSVSHKDALAATLPKARRGAVTGLASSLAAAGVLAFGALLAAGTIPLAPAPVALAVALAGALLLLAALVFLVLPEPANPAPDAEEASSGLAPLAAEPELRRFVVARALLAATAFAPPFIVLAAGEAGPELSDLGGLLLASGLAYAVSGRLWGRLADRSSRRALATAGALACVTLAGAAFLAPNGPLPFAPVFLFLAALAHAGVRTARKTHLTDMAPKDAKAAWTAAANTVLGLVLLAGAALGPLADAQGPWAVLALLSLASLAAVPASLRLAEAQTPSQAAP